MGGGRDADGRHVLLEPGHLALGQLAEVHPALPGHAQDVVVDVGDVLDVRDLGAQVAEIPHQHVELDVREGVAEVGRVVRRDPAHVDTHVGPELHGPELGRAAVAESKGHPP